MTPGRFEPFGGQPVWAAKRRKRRNKEGIHRPDSRPHRRVVTPCEVTSKRVKSTCALNRSPGSSERIPISRLHPPYPHCYTRKSFFSARLHPVTPVAHAPARSEESAMNLGAFPNAFGRRGSGIVRGRRTPATDETNLSVSIRVPSWFPHLASLRPRLHPRPSVSIRG